MMVCEWEFSLDYTVCRVQGEMSCSRVPHIWILAPCRGVKREDVLFFQWIPEFICTEWAADYQPASLRGKC